MAKTTTWKPRRIRSEEERGSGSSQYISLEEGQKFLGYALFEADPKVDDPAYYEYAEHWVDKRSVPCAGDDCPLCEDGDRPKTRAKTVWLVTQDEKGNKIDPPELRIFNFNFNGIKEFTALRAEDEKIKGRAFRVTRNDDRGNYSYIPKTDTLKATELKEWLKDTKMPDLEGMLTSQLRKAMEGLAVARAVEDEGEPDGMEDEKPSGKSSNGSKGKAAGKAATSAAVKAKAWPAELDEETVVVVEVEDDGNYFTAKSDDYKGTKNIYTTKGIEFDFSDLSEDDLVKVSATLDDDGDYILSAEPDTDGAGDESEEKTDAGELPESIEDEEMEITSIEVSESTMDVKSEEYEFTLYFLDTMTIDFDDYEVGQTIIVTAEKDSQDDMVATEIPKVKGAVAKKGGRKTTAGAKGK